MFYNQYIFIIIHNKQIDVAELGNLDEFVYLDKSGDVDGPRRVNYLGHKC